MRSGQEHLFRGIPRGEWTNLFEFIQAKQLRIDNFKEAQQGPGATAVSYAALGGGALTLSPGLGTACLCLYCAASSAACPLERVCVCARVHVGLEVVLCLPQLGVSSMPGAITPAMRCHRAGLGAEEHGLDVDEDEDEEDEDFAAGSESSSEDEDEDEEGNPLTVAEDEVRQSSRAWAWECVMRHQLF